MKRSVKYWAIVDEKNRPVIHVSDESRLLVFASKRTAKLWAMASERVFPCELIVNTNERNEEKK